MSGICSAHQGHDPSCRLCCAPIPGTRGYHARKKAYDREQERLAGHECRRPSTCCCRITADEPSDDCPIHGAGEWPPRCETCGRLMPWPAREQEEQP